jgi:AcrR family transcriptional regulator
VAKSRNKTETRDRILLVAKELFATKGKHGVNIEEIAKAADVNKRMVYYYFENKDNLFYEVLKYIITNLFMVMQSKILEFKYEIDFNDSISLIKHFIKTHFRVIMKDRDSVLIFLNTLSSDSAVMIKALNESLDEYDLSYIEILVKNLEKSIGEKKLRSVNIRQVLISIIGMNLFYVYGKPMSEVILGLKVDDEELFLEERLNSIIDLVLYGLIERS